MNSVRGLSIGCTGEPHCNFAVTETKTRLGSLIEGLEQRFGSDVEGLRLHLDGCPHACGQHWVGDIGFQGTTARDPEGKRHQAYDVLLRGALGPRAAIGRPVFKRVLSDELDAASRGSSVAGSQSANQARASARSATASRTRSWACSPAGTRTRKEVSRMTTPRNGRTE